MLLQRSLFLSLLLVLFVQIAALDPFFSVPRIEYADFKEKLQGQALHIEKRVHETLFSSAVKRKFSAITFTGDVMLARNVEVLMKREGESYPFAGLSLPSMFPGSAVVGNFESSMSTPHAMTPPLQMRFSTDASLIPALLKAGFTHFSLANNHSFDYGEMGYDETVQNLERSGLAAFGHGRSVGKDTITYLESDEGPIALVGINATAEIPQEQELVSLLAHASQNSVHQIIYIHWGTEYELTHSRAQELLARELVVAGADLIIGHHPHVVQDIAIIDGVVVFYSLGNYIFDQYFSDEVKQGLVVSLLLGNDPQLILTPVSSHEILSQPSHMQQEEQVNFLSSLAERSDTSLKSDIQRGVIPVFRQVATSTKMAMIVR